MAAVPFFQAPTLEDLIDLARKSYRWQLEKDAVIVLKSNGHTSFHALRKTPNGGKPDFVILPNLDMQDRLSIATLHSLCRRLSIPVTDFEGGEAIKDWPL